MSRKEELTRKTKKYHVKGYEWKNGKCECKVTEFSFFDDAVAFIVSSTYHFGKIFNEIGEMIHEIVNNHEDKHHRHHGPHDPHKHHDRDDDDQYA